MGQKLRNGDVATGDAAARFSSSIMDDNLVSYGV
jgi:hypothetical protein